MRTLFAIFVVLVCAVAVAESWDDFFLSYQKFLQTKSDHPRPKDSDSDAEKAEKQLQHRLLADRYEKFSDRFAEFARRDDLFPPSVPDVKREKSQKITGSWNFYKNVPANSLDLWQEACFLKFRSLLHAAIADPSKLAKVNEYAAEIEKHRPLDSLFQTVKRTWYGASLRLIDDARKREDDPDVAAAFEAVVADYTDFLAKHPTEENLNVAEPILALSAEIFPEAVSPPSSGGVPPALGALSTVRFDVEDRLRQAFEKIRNETTDIDLRNLAEILDGVLRRQGLLGNDLPIWGCDVNGKSLDPKILDGKVVLLDFWATWCGPCVAEFPRLKKLYEKYREKGFEIVGYCFDSDLDTMYAYLKRNPLPWIVLAKTVLAEEGSRYSDRPLLSTHYGAKRLPVVLLRDRNGKAVLLDARGGKLEETLEKMFE